MALLRFESVSFRYPDAETNALEALSFSIEKGEYVVVCGESGCGKTTLLRMIKSELRPVGQGEGTVYYKDKPVQQLNAEQSAFKIGFVQQNPDNQIVTDYVWHELHLVWKIWHFQCRISGGGSVRWPVFSEWRNGFTRRPVSCQEARNRC